MSQNNPGQINILVDQSGEMKNRDQSKELAASAVNKILYTLTTNCETENDYWDVCMIRVLGYGQGTYTLVEGRLPQIAKLPKRVDYCPVYNLRGRLVDCSSPIWVEPLAEGNTTMTAGLKNIFKGMREWIFHHPNCFPPVLIHISGSAPRNKKVVRAQIEIIKNLSTLDGNALVMNLCVNPDAQNELIIFPLRNEINNKCADFLFSISSELPDHLRKTAEVFGFPRELGSKCYSNYPYCELLVMILNIYRVFPVRF